MIPYVKKTSDIPVWHLGPEKVEVAFLSSPSPRPHLKSSGKKRGGRISRILYGDYLWTQEVPPKSIALKWS